MLRFKISHPSSCISILSLLMATAAFGYTNSPLSPSGLGTRCSLHRRRLEMMRLPRDAVTSGRSSNIKLFSSPEFGAISASNFPPRLNPTLIEAALAMLPWETVRIDNEEVAAAEEFGSGEQWYNTRKILTRLWVLPRDMSNGSWEAYAAAANNGEDKMLSAVPQLLRLSPEDVESSAKFVLSVLRLPPALLRREPLLLTVPTDRLLGGFDRLVLIEKKKTNQDTKDELSHDADETIRSTVREACKDIPGLLLEAATRLEED